MPSAEQLIEQGQRAEREGRREDARRLYEAALRSLEGPGSACNASALLRWIGRTYQTDADADAALDCLEAALAVAEIAGDCAGFGHAINLQAIVYWQCGDLDRAEALYTQAREAALGSDDKRLAALTAQNLGVIANVRGDVERALHFYTTSLSEFRGLGATKETCAGLNNAGKLYTELERWDDAGRSFDEAGEIASVLGDVEARILVEVNRGEMQIARGDFGAARESCLKALRLSEESGDTHLLGEIHRHLGTVSREFGEFVRGEQHYESADLLARERGNLLLLAETARERGELYRRQGRNREALQQLNRAHKLFTELRAKRHLDDLNRRTGSLESYFLDVVRHWGESIESKDRYTQGHCARVADIASSLAARAGMDSRELFWFRIGALLHDVGKLIVPPDLLNKPGKLTPDEWLLVQRHPIAGVEMLSDVDFPGDIIDIVRSHHERWDGTGYPDRLAGDQIPRSARMLCIADVYDALTSKRSYKTQVSHDKAIAIMREGAGTQFDPELFAMFEALMQTPQGAALARASEPRLSGAMSMAAVDPTARDDLTGLPTRRPFIEAANRVLGDRHQFATAALLVVDVDEFKKVNDAYGHLQGDDVLRTVADTLRAQVGELGIIGRYAGDEFVALLPQTSAHQSREVALRIGLAIREQQIAVRDRPGTISVTLSIGAAMAEAEHRDFDALFAAADRALYEAKRRGRDCVVTADETAQAVRDPQLNIRHFVGRKEETTKLARLFESTLERGLAVVTVLGEAGVGKSTLVRQLVPELRLRGGSLVGGRSLEADVKRPYAPWAEAISAINLLGVAPARSWRELPRLVPELGTPTNEPGQTKYVLYDEIVSYVRTAAESRPFVIVLDDMQWADTASWDVLEHVMAALERERVLICLTVRAEDANKPVIDRLRRLSRDERYLEIWVPRLSPAEVATWVKQIFDFQELDEGLTPLLHRYSEGNPFLTTQILRMLLEDRLVHFTNGKWQLRSQGEFQLPAAVSGLMERRLDRLSRGTRRILSTAAVIGRVFDIDIACAAGAGTEDELLDAVDEGTEHAVLEAVGSSGSTYSFTHPLLVDAMTRSVNGRRLSRIHERVASALEEHSPNSVAEIALHYDRAGNKAKSFQFALAAGTGAVAVYAHTEARSFFGLAVRSAEKDQERATATFRLAEVAETEGAYATVEHLCEEVLEQLGPRVGVGEYLPLRRMRERVRVTQGRPPADTIAACQSLLAEAVALGERAEEAALLGMISQAHSRLANWDEASAVANQAAEAAAKAGDPKPLADALTRLGITLMDRAPSEAIAQFNRALELYRGMDDRYGQARCLINLGITYARRGQSEDAERAYAQGLETARAAHASDLAGLAGLNLGVYYLKRGQTLLAGERFKEALAAFSAANSEPHRLATLLNLAHLARENGNWVDADRLYSEAITLAIRTGHPDVELGARAGAGLVAIAVGRNAEAEQEAEVIAERVDARPGWWFQGREIVDALRIRMASTRSNPARAARLFYESVDAARTRDLYATGWLIAECASSLANDSAPSALIAELTPKIESHGFAGLAARFATLRLTLAGGAGGPKEAA